MDGQSVIYHTGRVSRVPACYAAQRRPPACGPRAIARGPAPTPRVLPACHARESHHERRARTRRPNADLGMNCIAVRTRWRPVSARPSGAMISKGRHSGYPIASLNPLSTRAQLASWFASRSARHTHAHHPRTHANHHTQDTSQHNTTPTDQPTHYIACTCTLVRCTPSAVFTSTHISN